MLKGKSTRTLARRALLKDVAVQVKGGLEAMPALAVGAVVQPLGRRHGSVVGASRGYRCGRLRRLGCHCNDGGMDGRCRRRPKRSKEGSREVGRDETDSETEAEAPEPTGTDPGQYIDGDCTEDEIRNSPSSSRELTFWVRSRRRALMLSRSFSHSPLLSSARTQSLDSESALLQKLTGPWRPSSAPPHF